MLYYRLARHSVVEIYQKHEEHERKKEKAMKRKTSASESKIPMDESQPYLLNVEVASLDVPNSKEEVIDVSLSLYSVLPPTSKRKSSWEPLCQNYIYRQNQQKTDESKRRVCFHTGIANEDVHKK